MTFDMDDPWAGYAPGIWVLRKKAGKPDAWNEALLPAALLAQIRGFIATQNGGGVTAVAVDRPEATGELFDGSGRVRADDHATSQAGAEDVAFRANTQKAVLLSAYEAHSRAPNGRHPGMNAEEAATITDLLGACYWKRVGELFHQGLVEQVTVGGVSLTRAGTAGVEREVYRITEKGRTMNRTLHE